MLLIEWFYKMIENRIFTINSLEFDETIHRSWKGKLIHETEEIIIFEGVFDEEIKHPYLDVIRRGTISIEYYWKNRWYNIFRFVEPEGGLRNFYCNINRPPVIENGILNFIDLDIDVLIWKDWTYEILDLGEFQENAQIFNYSAKLQNKVWQSLDELLKLIENKDFPFNIPIK